MTAVATPHRSGLAGLAGLAGSRPRTLGRFLTAALLQLALVSGASGAAPKAKAKAKAKGKTTAAAVTESAGASTPPADSSPTAELKKTNAELKKILAKRPPSWSPEDELKNSEVKRLVDNLLDFEELARRSLAKHWETLTAKQRSEFVSTLQQLVERNYINQMYGQPDYDLKFDKETKSGNEATVTGSLAAVRKGKKVNVGLEYHLVYKAGHWVVYDVVTDELSLLENYRAEFNKIIDKEGFDKLLARMKKKLGEKGTPTAEKTP